MNFNEHYELRNKHAFFSPSKHYWLRWDEDKIKSSYINAKAAEKGTRLSIICYLLSATHTPWRV